MNLRIGGGIVEINVSASQSGAEARPFPPMFDERLGRGGDCGRARIAVVTRAVQLPKGIRAVVFDLDGLLVDTESLWFGEESALLADHGAEYTADDHLATVGQTIDASIAYFVRRIGLSEVIGPNASGGTDRSASRRVG